MTNKPANWTNAARNAPAALRFHTIREVAERLNVCERTVRRWIDSKSLPAHRPGRLVRISNADLAAFLATHRDA
jgi:excisionase family DNA binding protein